MGGVVRTTPCLFDVLADDIDVANFATSLVVLAVQVDLGLRVALHDRADTLGHRHGRVFVGSQHVGHDGNRSQRLGRAQRQVQNRAQVLLKLRGYTAVLGPVAGVVRAHGQLVNGDILLHHHAGGTGGRRDNGARILLSTKSEEFNGQNAGHSELGGNLDTDLQSSLGQLRREVRGWGKSLGTNTLALDGLRHRPCLDLTGGAACHKYGQLPSQSDLFLGHERSIRGKKLFYQRFQLLGRGEPHAVAVIATAAGLEAHAAFNQLGESAGILHRLDGGEARHRGTQVGELLAHEQLVLRVEEGGRLRVDVVGGVDKRAHMLRRHVLVFKGHSIGAFGRLRQHLIVVVITEDDVRDDLRGRLIRRGRQEAQVDVELSGSRLHHARKLAVSKNSNDRFVLFTHPFNTSLGVMIVRHTIFQNSLMTALLDGIYDGEMTIGELLGKGNFGIGTFDALDGEMIILDGVCYQLRGDGTATVADLDQGTPFAVATNFVPRIKVDAPKGLKREELSAFIDELEPSANYMYAVRITGRFSNVVTRTVVKQSKPYPPMAQAVGGDKELRFSDVEGTIGGFRTPVFEKGISVPGCHVHFIDAARTSGGHVLDYTVDEATIELCPGTDLDLRLPLTHEFRSANLAPDDLDQQLHTTEIKD
mgnify:CR=1 FL=1